MLNYIEESMLLENHVAAEVADVTIEVIKNPLVNFDEFSKLLTEDHNEIVSRLNYILEQLTNIVLVSDSRPVHKYCKFIQSTITELYDLQEYERAHKVAMFIKLNKSL